MRNYKSVEFHGHKLYVEYEVEGSGHGPSYSPLNGAEGGDPFVVGIVKATDEETGEEVKLSDEDNDALADVILAMYEENCRNDYSYEEDRAGWYSDPEDEGEGD